MAASYQVQVQRESGEWITITTGRREFCMGYLVGRADQPGPRLMARVVDQVGKVFAGSPAMTDVAIGQVAGSPSVEQLEAAGARVLARAAALRAHQEREADRDA